MMIAMPDSVTVADLPPGYPAYLGYADGHWPTETALDATFPDAEHLILTVTGGTLRAQGCDIETGDLSPESGANWVQRKLVAAPLSRPVAYASVSRMPDVIAALGTRGIKRAQVRLLSAHYRWAGTEPSTGNYGEHICGPATCAWPGVPPMDGTQWTDRFPGMGGRLVDMSLLVDGFFGPPPLTWTERLVQELPVVQQGDAGEAVRTVQGLCNSRHSPVAVDGLFGPKTRLAVMSAQKAGGITQDGVVGKETWPVLLGIS